MDLVTYVTDRKGHDMRYAIESRKWQEELGWEPSLQFEEGIEETVKWYLFRKPTRPSLPLRKGVLKSSRPSLPLKKAPPFSPSLSSIVFTTPSVPLVGDRNLRDERV